MEKEKIQLIVNWSTIIALISFVIAISSFSLPLPLFYDYNTYEISPIHSLQDCQSPAMQIMENGIGGQHYIVTIQNCASAIDSKIIVHKDAKLVEDFVSEDLLSGIGIIFSILGGLLVITILILTRMIKTKIQVLS